MEVKLGLYNPTYNLPVDISVEENQQFQRFILGE